MGNRLCYTRVTNSVEGTKQLAATLAPYLRPGDVIILEGNLGAGKTQFVQGVASALGITDAVTSPTFNLLLSYSSERLPLYHFDLYRLAHPSQLEDIGFYETLEGDGVSFVEWGSRFPEAMPYDYIAILLAPDSADSGKRKITIQAVGDRARQLLYVWANDSKSRLMRSSEAPDLWQTPL